MEKYLKIIVIILFFALFVTYILKFSKAPLYLSDTVTKLPKEEEIKLLKILDKVNLNSEMIESIVYNDIKIKLTQGITFRAKGYLFFERNKKLRIFINHGLFGREMDIGSNEDVFWFWSKRMRPSAIYFSSHKDLNKTNLKTPLNPDWILESFGFSTINKNEIEFVKCGDYLGIKQYKLSNNCEQVCILTLLDQYSSRVVGKYLYDCEDHLLASVELKSYKVDSMTGIQVPNNILISWYDENIFMEWSIEDIILNKNIN